MRIPSLIKIVKQAEAWQKNHPVIMPEEWQIKMKETTDKLEAAKKQWREATMDCPANTTGFTRDCNCNEHPLYAELKLGTIKPLANEVNFLWSQKCVAEGKQLFEKKRELQIARDAKLKYLSTQY